MCILVHANYEIDKDKKNVLVFIKFIFLVSFLKCIRIFVTFVIHKIVDIGPTMNVKFFGNSW